jgi:hypothetical protein
MHVYFILYVSLQYVCKHFLGYTVGLLLLLLYKFPEYRLCEYCAGLIISPITTKYARMHHIIRYRLSPPGKFFSKYFSFQFTSSQVKHKPVKHRILGKRQLFKWIVSRIFAMLDCSDGHSFVCYIITVTVTSLVTTVKNKHLQ